MSRKKTLLYCLIIEKCFVHSKNGRQYKIKGISKTSIRNPPKTFLGDLKNKLVSCLAIFVDVNMHFI